MKKSVITIFLTVALLPALAQTDKKTEEESVKKTIGQFFEGMQKRDTALMFKTLADTATLQTVMLNRKGAVYVRYETVGDLLVQVTKTPKELTLDERISFEGVHIDGNLASVWTPYKFYINNNFSHCGANSFTLVKLKGEWRIVNIIDTRRKEGCE